MNTLSPLSSRRTALGLGGLLAAATIVAGVHAATASDSPAIKLKSDDSVIVRNRPEPASFADVVKLVSPSVVKITVSSHAHHNRLNSDDSQIPDELRQFFNNRRGGEMQEEPKNGLGSGVIISTDGYIVTNNHVVDGADELTVSLSDGRDLTAKVVGRDPQTDVAVVKVDAKDLPAITFAPSDKVEVGDRVLAVGNPFGIGETVTTGIVSAKGRRAGLGLVYEDFIQTDAAINPGNSGGALVDIDGRLVGMNTAILSRSGGFQGVGLAVPSDLVSYVADTLVKHGKVVRAYIGVGVQDITPAIADSFGLKARVGAIVTDVQPGSPAAKAGIASGDVITSIEGKPIDSSSRLALTVSESNPGTKLAIDLLHDGKAENLFVTTTSKPNTGQADSDDNGSVSSDDQGVLNGVAVDELDSNTRSQMDIPGRVKGALITDVAPDSASARAGIRPGDVILEINRHPVSSAKEAIDLSSSATNRKTLLKLWSHGGTVFVVVVETDRQPAQ